MARRRLHPAIFALVTLSHAFAQSQSAPVHYEAASVKLHPGASGLTSIAPCDPTRFAVTNAPLDLLIGMAYNMNSRSFVNAPGWLNEDRYDVVATAGEGVTLDCKSPNFRLQALLADRFHLVVHREMRTAQGYALVAARGGPKLQASEMSKPGVNFPRGMRLYGQSMAGLAGALELTLNCPVADHTGLSGSYDISLDYAPPNGDTDMSLPSIFTALEQQAGLKLEAQKVPFEVLTIDHVERIPADN